MKLNADLVCAGLERSYSIDIFGPRSKELRISRPEFYMDGSDMLMEDHLYLATVEHLPLRPKIGKNVVLVCVGDAAKLSYYKERCCVMVIRNKADFFSVHKALEDVFDRYAQWEQDLFRIFLESAGIQAISDNLCALLDRDVVVLDSSFTLLAHSEGSMPANRPIDFADGRNLSTEALAEYLKTGNMLLDRHGAIVFDIEGTHSVCANLFDRNDRYSGCLVVLFDDDEPRPGEDVLVEITAKTLEKALEMSPSVLSDQHSVLKSALQDIVGEMPLSASRKWALSLHSEGAEYICISLHYASHLNQLPASYACNAFENEFVGSIAFEYDESIVCFVPTAPLTDHSGSYFATLNRLLSEFLAKTIMVAGISNPFTDLYDARSFYKQAEVALDCGRIVAPKGELYYFDSYALIDMIMNSTGSLRADLYYPRGMPALIEHDGVAGVSYIDTLRVFLDENMSYTAAARALYIHRSTLIDRIERIEKELGLDLHDPEARLRVLMSLKAMEIEASVKAAATELR